jgi:hypothetical protein
MLQKVHLSTCTGQPSATGWCIGGEIMEFCATTAPKHSQTHQLEYLLRAHADLVVQQPP